MGKLSLNLCIQKRDENTGQGFPQPPVHKVWEPLKCCAAEIACSINCSKCCCLSSFRCTEGFGNKTLLVYSLEEEEAVASNCQELHMGAGPAVVQLPPPARCRYFLNMSCFGFFFFLYLSQHSFTQRGFCAATSHIRKPFHQAAACL